MDYGLFSKIKPRELIGANWIKECKDSKSPNLLNYINWERYIINWLVTEIVSQGNQKLKIQTMEKIITIGQVYSKSLNILAYGDP